MDYFKPDMSLAEINRISMLGLAHIGDAVFELMTRAALCEEGHSSVRELHQLATKSVNAPAQAAAAQKLQSVLSEDEAAIFRRGRNAHVNSIPHAANVGEYHAATALEALFGWLYLQGNTERLNELYRLIRAGEREN